MGKMKVTPVDEVNWGLYMWQMPDDSLVMDDDGGYLCIPARKGDVAQINKLRKVAEGEGLDEGKPIFFAGHRMVTQEELEEQKSRGALGLVPDPQDLPAMMDYIKEAKELGLA
jgi:hypothetical protein